MGALKKLFGWMANRLVISILGLILIALLIWFFGPLIAFAGFAPLEGAISRLVLILVIVVIWALYQVLRTRQERKANDSIVQELARGSAPEDPKAALSREEVERLQQRFRDALDTLKQAKLGGKTGRRYLYQLPWYVMIGPPGCGKTTALANSGLKFPLADRFGKDGVTGVGGTRNCDWFFTDEAVLIDTAGRYTTQDSDEAVDRSAWQGFVQLLRKHRRQRPIDGILVAFSITDLASRDKEERLSHARAVKRRIQELYTGLEIKAPVYVVFTKCDLIAGFNEYFSSLRAEEREQAWGTTFPLAASQQPNSAIEGFGGEFDALLERVSSRIITRLEEERDMTRRGLLFSFPQQMALLKEPIGEFLEEAFGQSKFEEPSFLRGVYFTSATQEGTPIDRVIGSIAATFGLERQAMPAFAGKGVSYFLTRPLRDVIFPESGLVTSTGFFARNRHWIVRGAYAGTALLTLLVLLVLFNSYSGNRSYVAQVDDKVEQYRKRADELRTGGGDIVQLVQVLSMLRDLPGGYAERDKGAPIGLSFGLWQGGKLGSAARAAYLRSLNGSFLPRLMARLEQQINENLQQSEFLYQALKVYLMIATPDRRDNDLIKLWIASDWQARYPGAANAAFLADFNSHLEALFANEITPTPQANSAVVDRARRQLLQLPLANRVYGQIKSENLTGRLKPWTLAEQVSPDPIRFFSRRSGKPMTDGVSGFFTVDGYKQLFIRDRNELIDLAVQETWVLGPEYERLQARDQREDLTAKVSDLYVAEYIKVWDDVVNDLDVAPFYNIEQHADLVRALAQPDSPLKAILKAISQQTQLSAATQVPLQEKIESTITDRVRQRIQKVLPKDVVPGPAAAAVDPATKVDQHFEKLHALVREDGGKPPQIDGVMGQLNELHGYLLQVQQAEAQGKTTAAIQSGGAIAKVENQAKFQIDPIKRMMQGITKTSATLTVGKAKERIEEVWSTTVAQDCRQALAGRYPFVKASTTDVNLADFTRIIGPGGSIEKFSKEFVEPFADTSVRPWRWLKTDGASLDLSPSSLRLFESAAVIKQAFFPTGSPPPAVTFEIEPLDLDGKARQVQLDVGEQSLVYQHGPRRPSQMKWPGQGGTAARIVFTPATDIGQTIAASKSGPWALFRLLDSAQILGSGGGDQFKVTFVVDGYQAVFQLRAGTVINPFSLPELQQFRCQDKLS
jgi:type VI secretion system protein ImpL